MITFKRTNGIVAATFAAYHPDGSPNLSVIPGLVDKLAKEGVSGVFVCGTNGEGLSMSSAERMATVEGYVSAAGGRMRVFVHVGHASIRESQKLARHAADAGADAISSLSAFYFKPSSVENLVDCLSSIASAAPELPFYYYHMPSRTGVNMDMNAFLEVGGSRIPNLAGIKYTAPALHEYQACVDFRGGAYEVLFGQDEMLLGALAVGASGAIGSTYTFAAPVYLDMIRLFRDGKLEEARDLQAAMVNMIRCIIRYSPIPSQRAIMKMLGYDLGPPRLPLTCLSEDGYSRLQADLHELGFFELLQKYKQNPGSSMGVARQESVIK